LVQTAALASGASGQRGNSKVRAHSASEDARKRADDTRPEPGPSARAVLVALVLAFAGPIAEPANAADRPVRIVALGDSLTAGLGLSADATFPAKLEKALRAKGLTVEVSNAGVSGDTASGGLARLDWSVPEGTDAVIVELGANDMLRGIDPKVTRTALEEIVRRLTERRIIVLLAGMRAAPNLGPDYGRAFETIYSDLAAKNGLLLYPFFLDGVAAEAKLNQHDGLHPTAAGIDAIVTRILPKAEELVGRVRRAGERSERPARQFYGARAGHSPQTGLVGARRAGERSERPARQLYGARAGHFVDARDKRVM
jgi:acyl-CoA thioesterase-1